MSDYVIGIITGIVISLVLIAFAASLAGLFLEQGTFTCHYLNGDTYCLKN